MNVAKNLLHSKHIRGIMDSLQNRNLQNMFIKEDDENLKQIFS